MANEHFLRAQYRSARRVWLNFDNALTSGAFSAAHYTVAAGATPITVSAALSVTGSPGLVELALASDMAEESEYACTWTDVPLLAAGVVSGYATVAAPRTPNTIASGTTRRDIDADLYQTDLAFDRDLVETPTGALSRVSGQANVIAALARKAESEPLFWAPTYSPKVRQYCDAPGGMMASAKADLERALLEDDRVKAVRVQILASEGEGEARADKSDALVELIGGQQVKIGVG